MSTSKESVLQESERILDLIHASHLSAADRQRIVDDSLENFPLYVTKAILEHRKSCSDDFSVAEWEDEGSVFRDTHGNEYIDCLGGFGVYLLGHRHPKVVAAVQAQLARYALHSQELIDPLRGYLSKLVAMITPGDLRHSYLVNCGTEANEMALKLARLATGKRCFVSTVNGFHGKTMFSLAASGKAMFREPYFPLVGGFYHVPYGDAPAMEQMISTLIQTGETVAGIIVEPVQGEGGVNIPPADYLPELRRICDQYECVMIVDEVQTGMGRTGTLFGVNHTHVVPDIMTLGKAFGGGVVPTAAMVARPHLWTKMEENPFILGSSTFGGSPLVCAGAIAGIHTIFEEDIPGQARDKGNYFLKHLRDMQVQYPDVLREVRGLGLLIGLDFINNEAGYNVAKRLFSRNVLVGGTLNNARVIRIEPPAVISYEQIDTVLDAVAQSLKEESRVPAAR